MIPPADTPLRPLPADEPDIDISAQILIETLSARLLAGHSATAVLEAWCAERGLSGPALVARRLPGEDRPIRADQRHRFALGPDEPVLYRRVGLACGPHVLSEADNWYAPGRLTPEMNHLLESTQRPFGRVVHSLAPTRRNLGLRMLWTGGAVEADDKLFAIEAVLSTPDGVPFCEVHEIYLGAVLAGR